MDKLSPSKAWGYPKAMFFSLFILRNINGRPHRVAPTASEQAALRSDFEYKISHMLRCPSFSAKSHVCFGYVPQNVHITPSRHYQLFTVFMESGAQGGRNAYIPYGTLLDAKRLKIIKSRGVYVAFYTSVRVEMQRIS